MEAALAGSLELPDLTGRPAGRVRADCSLRSPSEASSQPFVGCEHYGANHAHHMARSRLAWASLRFAAARLPCRLKDRN